jgi:hypothetical protein
MAVLARHPEESMSRMTALATGNPAGVHPFVPLDSFSADAFSLLPNSNTRHVSY